MTANCAKRILEPEGVGESEERLRVIVAEGNASDLFWLEMVFKSSRLPYSIEVVNDAREAMASFATSRPDLIILDALDSSQTMSAPAPLFILTNSIGEAGSTEPTRRYIEKPFTHQKLVECLMAASLHSWVERLPGRAAAAQPRP